MTKLVPSSLHPDYFTDSSAASDLSRLTLEVAEGRREQLASALVANGSSLVRCAAANGGKPCWHALCPVCQLVAERWLLRSGLKVIRRVARRTEIRLVKKLVNELALVTMTSVVRINDRNAECRHKEDIGLAIGEFRRRFELGGVALAIGMIEFRGIQDPTSQWERQYEVRLRSLALALDVTDDKAKLAIAPSTRFTRLRPGQRVGTIQLLYGRGRVPSLLDDRIRQRHITPGVKKSRRRYGPQISRTTIVPDSELQPLLRVCRHMSIADRIILHGARLIGDDDGYMTVRARRSAIDALNAKRIALDAAFSDL